MFNLDDNKIEFALGYRAQVFWLGQKAENAVFFYFVNLFVSDSWYCQIQTTRLIMFFCYLFRSQMKRVKRRKRARKNKKLFKVFTSVFQSIAIQSTKCRTFQVDRPNQRFMYVPQTIENFNHRLQSFTKSFTGNMP